MSNTERVLRSKHMEINDDSPRIFLSYNFLKAQRSAILSNPEYSKSEKQDILSQSTSSFRNQPTIKSGSRKLVNPRGKMRKGGTSKFKKAMTMMEDDDSFMDKGTGPPTTMSSKETRVKSGLTLRADPPKSQKGTPLRKRS